MQQISVREIHNTLSDALSTVFYGKQPVAITRRGKPMAVLIPPEWLESCQEWQQRRQQEGEEVAR